MAKCNISQKEQVDILKSWKEIRENEDSRKPFFMLVQWVPIGSSGGMVICRPVSAPVKNGK